MQLKATAATGITVLALAAPAAADECGCLKFSRQFKKRADAQWVYDSEMIARGVSDRGRRKVKRGIYDYAANGYTSDDWCNRFPKHCKALKACLLAGGSTWAKDYAEGKSKQTATKDAAYACAVAAAGVYLIA